MTDQYDEIKLDPTTGADPDSLKYYQGDDKVITFEEARQQEDAQAPEWAIKTGIPTIDGIIQGFHPGEVIVLSGPTGHGKSTLCHTFTKHMVKLDAQPLWFHYEGSRADFLAKMKDITVEALIPKTMKANALVWVEERIKEAKLKKGTKVVFMDHLHYLIDMALGNNRTSSIDAVMRNLVTMAVEHQVVIFLVAHIKKPPLNKDGKFKRPTLDDIRDSAMIAAEARFVIMVRRTGKWKGDTGTVKKTEGAIDIEKNARNGEFRTIEVQLKDGFFVEKPSGSTNEEEKHAGRKDLYQD